MTPGIASSFAALQGQSQSQSSSTTQPALPGLEGAMSQSHFRNYRPVPGIYDELFASTGVPRPVWSSYLSSLEKMEALQLERRWEQARRLIHENGVTYNVYGDPRGLDRPWVLDPLPLVIGAEEWAVLEKGMIQRAQLLNAVLADLYGPQRLIREGLLPPELVMSHAGFLRPCFGIRPPNDCYMHLYAMNLARDSDGNWKILADRTQAPSGAGYALENRIVLSRTFPEIFRNCQVQRLASFFRAMKENLFTLATRHRENPRIALFTPGPYNETYFEHSYLARYLGYSLVEGADLAVRDEGVFLKTLGGLLPIDVILRRLDDDFCDPLELREDSQLGVPGLVQAVRSGNVSVANALGSGWAESAALTAFLPALCRHFFNEDLKLPSVKTWWCGEPQSLKYVKEHLDELVIKPAVPGVTSWGDPRAKGGHHVGFEPVFGNRLPASERERLLSLIEARPYEYAAQETLALPSIPVWSGQEFKPRHWVLRTYLTASQGTYLAMPGGLTRVTSDADSMVVSMQRGGGSKDTWVLSSGPVSSFSLLRPPGQAIELRRGGIDLPSRVADNLYWLGRYAERAEGTVRLLRGLLGRLTDETGLSGMPELPSLLRMLTLLGYLPPAHTPTPPEGARERFQRLESELLSVITNEKIPGSLHGTLRGLRGVAWIVRDRISLDAWRILNQLDRELERSLRTEVMNTNDAIAMLNRLVMTLAGFSGLGMESMTRGQGWRFQDIGRRVERSIQTVNLLRGARLESGEEEGPVLEAVLEIADSSMTYRSRYLSSLQVVPVLDLLLMDETNPRSVAFQFAALQEHVQALPRDPSPAVLAAEQRVVLQVLARLRLADLNKLCDSREDGTRPRLEELLSDLTREIPLFSDALTRNYLAHAETAQQLSVRTEGAV